MGLRQSGVIFLISLLLGDGLSEEGLRIVPESSDGFYQRALGHSSVFTCVASVEIPERLTNFRWWWPDGKPIEQHDPRVEVMQDQVGSLTLLFSSVQEEDLGTYKCTATYATNLNLETQFTLKAFLPITFEDAPEFQYAVKGSDYKVKCRVKADPVPQVDWKKDHRMINDTEHYVIDKDGVVIRDVADADEGVYTCRVRVVQLGTVEERHIKVEVQEKPKMVSDPVDLEGVEGESAHFACLASGKPAPEYEWVNHKHEDLSRLERHVVDKYKGTLQIDGLKPEDSGLYRCTARNTAGFETSTSRLFVVTKPVIEELKNVTTEVGGKAVLRCRASGDPPPDIVFHKDSYKDPFPIGAQRDTRIFTDQSKDGRFTTAHARITDVARVDDGLYKCIAYNRRTRNELTGHITVEYPPTFANTPMGEAWSWDGRPVNVTCLAEGIPNATISWFMADNPMDVPIDGNTPYVRVIGWQSHSSLEVRPIDIRMYRFYKCVATNKHGVAEHSVHLREARRPDRVLQVIVHEKTATSIAYRIVGPVYDGGLPVTAFVAQYKEDRPSLSGWDEFKVKSWPVDQQIFIVDGLEPLRTYYFRFAAENQVGIGDWAHERPEVMPRRSAPEPPQILNEAYGGIAATPYPTKFELRWALPQDNGEPISAFLISYSPVRNITVIRERGREIPGEYDWEEIGQTVNEERALGEPRHFLTHLFPNTLYRVSLSARNAIGVSQPSYVVIRTASIPGNGGTTGAVTNSGKSISLISKSMWKLSAVGIVFYSLCTNLHGA